MSPHIETLKPLTCDPETNAEGIANLQQIIFAMLGECTALARICYTEARKSGSKTNMERAQQAGELFKSLEALLPDAF
jgi:hypothetical protein